MTPDEINRMRESAWLGAKNKLSAMWIRAFEEFNELNSHLLTLSMYCGHCYHTVYRWHKNKK